MTTFLILSNKIIRKILVSLYSRIAIDGARYIYMNPSKMKILKPMQEHRESHTLSPFEIHCLSDYMYSYNSKRCWILHAATMRPTKTSNFASMPNCPNSILLAPRSNCIPLRSLFSSGQFNRRQISTNRHYRSRRTKRFRYIVLVFPGRIIAIDWILDNSHYAQPTKNENLLPLHTRSLHASTAPKTSNSSNHRNYDHSAHYGHENVYTRFR